MFFVCLFVCLFVCFCLFLLLVGLTRKKKHTKTAAIFHHVPGEMIVTRFSDLILHKIREKYQKKSGFEFNVISEHYFRNRLV